MSRSQLWGIAMLRLGAVLLMTACQAPSHRLAAESHAYPDATYRGGFMDEGAIQVNLQFTLEDGIVTAASFRHLVGADPNYNLDTEEEPYRSVVAQYEEALQYLVGKPLSSSLSDLYDPGQVVTLEVDGYSGATIRANKIISSVRDALNRGPYQW